MSWLSGSNLLSPSEYFNSVEEWESNDKTFIWNGPGPEVPSVSSSSSSSTQTYPEQLLLSRDWQDLLNHQGLPRWGWDLAPGTVHHLQGTDVQQQGGWGARDSRQRGPHLHHLERELLQVNRILILVRWPQPIRVIVICCVQPYQLHSSQSLEVKYQKISNKL